MPSFILHKIKKMSNRNKYPMLTRETVFDLFVNQNMSDSEIAAFIGCSVSIIQGRRVRWEIKETKRANGRRGRVKQNRPAAVPPEHAGEFAAMLDYLFERNIYAYRIYKRLLPEQQRIADYGINRHRKYCEKCKCEVDDTAFTEIVKDAQMNRSVARENQAMNDATDYSQATFSDAVVKAFVGGASRNARRANKRGKHE